MDPQPWALVESTRRDLLAEPTLPARSPVRQGWKAYSQSEDDGIIQEIFRRIGVGSRRFVEIGVGDGLECNTTYLLGQGWRGTWIEADADHAAAIEAGFGPLLDAGRLRLRHARVTRENVTGILEDLAPAGTVAPDLFSLDIDGYDLHLLHVLDRFRPRVCVLEYNSLFRPPARWVLPYEDGHQWNATDRYGASLQSLGDLMAGHGYHLVACTLTGINAFFVRDDQVGDHFDAPGDVAAHFQPARYWMAPWLSDGHVPDPQTVCDAALAHAGPDDARP